MRHDGQIGEAAAAERLHLALGADEGITFKRRVVPLASYIIGVSRGAAFTAVPAFPRRLFSQNHIFVRRDAGIRTPGVQPGDVFVWSPEELIRNTFHDRAIAERLLATPPTPEQQETLIKNRFTFARLAWEPRLFDPHLNKWIKRIALPTQIIWGEQDRILPVAAAQAFREAMPQAAITVIPDCGHLPQSEKPDAFCDTLFKFLSGK